MDFVDPWLFFFGILAWISPGYAIARSCEPEKQQSQSASVYEESLLLQSGVTDHVAQLSYITEDENMQLYAWPPPVRIPGIQHALQAPTSKNDSAVVSTTSLCPLPWNKDPSVLGGVDVKKQCPHGKLLPLQITLPKNASFREMLSVFYSYVVYAVMVLASFELICTGPLQFRGIGTREASFILFAGFVAGIAWLDFIPVGSATRPELSCNFSCGMPSITSALAVGFLTLTMVDATFKVLPKMPRCAEDESEHDTDVPVASFWEVLSFIPLSGADMITKRQLCGFLALWILTFLPVPFARFLLQDHSKVQVIVGSLVGLCCGLIWFGVVRMLQKRYNGMLGQMVCVIFEHNYPLPRYEVKIRCARLLLEGAPDDEVKEAERELQWYTDEGRLEKQMNEVMSRLTGRSGRSPIASKCSSEGL